MGYEVEGGACDGVDEANAEGVGCSGRGCMAGVPAEGGDKTREGAGMLMVEPARGVRYRF